jgi:sec-independent protein translocase protein TatA
MFSGWERPSHWLVLAIVVIVLFGYKKLPDMSRSVGRSLRIFKTEMKGLNDDDAARDSAEKDPAAPAAQPAVPVNPPATPVQNAQTAPAVVPPTAGVVPPAPVVAPAPVTAPDPSVPTPTQTNG